MNLTETEYNKSTEFYTSILDLFNADFILYQSVINTLRPHSILELGCGSGRLFPLYINKIPVIYGIDISQEMLNKAALKFPSVQLVNSDIVGFKLPLKFDLIVLSNSLLKHIEHQSDRIKIINNAKEHLTDDGIILLDHAEYLYYEGKTTDWFDAENTIISKWLLNNERLQGYQWRKEVINDKDILMWRFVKNTKTVFQTQFTTFVYKIKDLIHDIDSIGLNHIQLLSEYDLSGLNQKGNRFIVAISKHNINLEKFKCDFVENFRNANKS